ncbi:hypothetical protein EYF80_002172 [Liparis tanakae]|uniref:BED-type domain-containing protein n=1 Tax=Liparis tanakae TaxID=230148 RepID=A0A4Z2JAS7_9TELE|nr:hypothetical protein EYF80_002172 [Liparis tanakae]
MNGDPEGAQWRADQPVKRKRNKRSLIWRHYEELSSLAAARCCICMKLQSFEGGTSNLHRHMSKKHPEVFSQLVADRQHPPAPPAPAPHSSQSTDANVKVVLEDGDNDTLNSTMNGLLDYAQGGPVKHIKREEESDDLPVKRRRNKRSLIWRHYELLDSLAAARCCICMKKLQYFEGGSTSNLHRHMSKRHPEVFSQLAADGQHPPAPHSHTLMLPESAGETEKQRPFSASKGEERVLIEALRRAQRVEARNLEYQRELLEKLRAVNAREAAAEREQIESLRTAQLEEARDLSRQRKEVQKETTALLRKWEELQQERERLGLFSS